MRAMNSRVGVNIKYLGAVGWQPTALIGNNAGYEQQGWGQHEVSWCCLLATMRAMNSRVGVNVRYFGDVSWQPTALIEGSLEVKLPTIWTVEKQR